MRGDDIRLYGERAVREVDPAGSSKVQCTINLGAYSKLSHITEIERRAIDSLTNVSHQGASSQNRSRIKPQGSIVPDSQVERKYTRRGFG